MKISGIKRMKRVMRGFVASTFLFVIGYSNIYVQAKSVEMVVDTARAVKRNPTVLN